MKKKINDMSKEEVIETIEKPMDDGTIKQYLPDAKIITYPELKKYKNIDDLFDKNNYIDYVILLYLDAPSHGHWCCLNRVGVNKKGEGIIEFFDPYGVEPDGQLKWVNDETKKSLGITDNYLTNLFNKDNNYDIIYNPVKYQEDNKKDLDINSCGRHCCYRIIQLLGNKKLLPDYYKFMKNIKNKTGEKYDEIVSRLINM